MIDFMPVVQIVNRVTDGNFVKYQFYKLDRRKSVTNHAIKCLKLLAA